MQEIVNIADSKIQNSEITTVNITKIKINEDHKNLIPQLSSEDYHALKENISKQGVLDTLKVNADFVLLDGHTRYQIAKELNITKLPVKFLKFNNIWDEKEFIITINRNRRHLNKAQLAELALKLADIERERAKERQKKLGADFGRLGGRGIKKGSEKYNKKASYSNIETKKTLRLNSSEGFSNTQDSLTNHQKTNYQNNQTNTKETGKTLEIAAQKIKVGYDSVLKAHKIKKEAEENPQIKKAWRDIFLAIQEGKYRKRKTLNAEFLIVGWDDIELDMDKRIEVVINREIPLSYEEKEILAKKDGFSNMDEMFNFFKDMYGLPFHGQLIRW